jgi:3-carboxy-cis,cis-muconate cycloisomerase
MPQKRNPIACSLALAAAHRVPGLVAAFLSSMVQEHERGVGGWQAQWPLIAGGIQATGLAVASMAEAAEGLQVDESRMQANLAATRGAVFAERVMLLLAPGLGRDAAHRIVEEAARRSAAHDRRLIEELMESPEVTGIIPIEVLQQLDSPADYLGVADELRARLLAGSD